MNVLYGTVYQDRPVSGMTTLNERVIEMLSPRVRLHLLVGRTAASSAQRARRSSVEVGEHEAFPAILVERDSRRIERCTAPGDNPEIDRFVDLLAEAMTRSRVDLVHMAEWEPVTGTAVFAAADKAGIPWVVMPADYRLVCPEIWLFEEGLRDCAGPNQDFSNCERCMAVGAPHLSLRHADLIWHARRALHYSGVRRVFPTLFAPRLPRYFDRKQWARRFDTIRRQLQTCRAILTMSDFQGAVLQRMLGLAAEKFRTVPFPSRAARPGYEPSPDRFRPPLRFVWIHRLGREWGPDLLLDGWKRSGLGKDEAQLFIYSGARAQGVTTDWMRSAGYGALLDSGSVVVTEERVHLREEEVYRHISAWVATPMWKLNAYSADPLGYALPMIFPRGTALTEIHQDGVNGFAYTRGDADSLASVLRRVGRNPALLEDAARRCVFTPAHGMDASAAKLLALYREILGEEPRAASTVP